MAIGDIATQNLQPYSVTSDKIALLSVSSGLLADGSVVTAKLADGAVTTSKLAAGAVTTTELGALAVTTAKIAAGAVTSNELGASAVISGKIAAGAVGTAELASGAVTTAKIGAAQVTATELASAAVTTLKLASGAVTTATIANSAVTSDKAALSLGQANSSGSQAMATGGTIYDAPSASIACVAGTWLLIASFTCLEGAAAASSMTLMIRDSVNNIIAIVSSLSLPSGAQAAGEVVFVVAPGSTTTYKCSASLATNNGTLISARIIALRTS